MRDGEEVTEKIKNPRGNKESEYVETRNVEI
jgi:hypothetical protein